MAQQYDLSKALDDGNASAVPKKKKPIGVIAAIVIGVLVLGSVGIGTAKYFAKDNYASNIPLSQNITKWTTGLNWYYGNSETKLKNDFGTWSRSKPNTPFSNSAVGCVINPFVIAGNGGVDKKDLASSQAYTSLFTKGQEKTQKTKEVNVSIQGNAGSIGVLKTSYKAQDGEPAIAYYRYIASNDSLRVLVVSCKESAELTKIAPYSGNGSELNKLNISLKPVS